MLNANELNIAGPLEFLVVGSGIAIGIVSITFSAAVSDTAPR